METCFVWDWSSTFQHRTWAGRFGLFSLFRTLWHPLIPWSLYVNAVNGGDLRCAAEVQLTGEASQQQQKLCSRFTVRLPFSREDTDPPSTLPSFSPSTPWCPLSPRRKSRRAAPRWHPWSWSDWCASSWRSAWMWEPWWARHGWLLTTSTTCPCGSPAGSRRARRAGSAAALWDQVTSPTESTSGAHGTLNARCHVWRIFVNDAETQC